MKIEVDVTVTPGFAGDTSAFGVLFQRKMKELDAERLAFETKINPVSKETALRFEYEVSDVQAVNSIVAELAEDYEAFTVDVKR